MANLASLGVSTKLDTTPKTSIELHLKNGSIIIFNTILSSRDFSRIWKKHLWKVKIITNNPHCYIDIKKNCVATYQIYDYAK